MWTVERESLRSANAALGVTIRVSVAREANKQVRQSTDILRGSVLLIIGSAQMWLSWPSDETKWLSVVKLISNSTYSPAPQRERLGDVM